MKTITTVLSAAVIALSLTGTALANPVLKPAQPGGSNQVGINGAGNYVGLLGISGNANEGLTPGGFNESDFLDSILASNHSSIVRWYYGTSGGPGAWVGNPAAGMEVTFPAAIASVDVASDNGKFFDSLWVEWTGGTLNFIRESGGTDNLPAVVSGSLFDQITFVPAGTVPVPSTLAIFGLGLLGLGAARRRRSSLHQA